jgi:hypothetical protein
MRGTEGSRELPQYIFRGHGLGLGWFHLDAIGRQGRCFWTAPCAEFREVSISVGGGSAWPGSGRVQRGCGRNGAWLGRDGARQGRAMVSWCFWLDAVQVCAWCGAGRGAGAPERRCALCVDWASKRAHVGVVGTARTDTLGGFRFRELILWLETGLVAR